MSKQLTIAMALVAIMVISASFVVSESDEVQAVDGDGESVTDVVRVTDDAGAVIGSYTSIDESLTNIQTGYTMTLLADLELTP